MRADFHSHTTHSDGELTPTALVKRAASVGVTHLAITDHDTISALLEATRAGRLEGVHVVPGIEVTTHLHGRECHLLGHHFLPTAPGLADWCAARREERHDRMRQMVDRLLQDGVPVSFDEVEREAAGATLGRPHLARVLVKHRYATSFQDAFDRLLSKGRSGYVERPRPDMPAAIALIRGAGGTASLAHPGVNKVSKAELRHLAELGVDAVEAYHPDHPPQQAGQIASWARELGIQVTGGSDFHGVRTGSVELGAEVTTPQAYEWLRARAEERQSTAELRAARGAWDAEVGAA